jgi:hypothetical protein
MPTSSANADVGLHLERRGLGAAQADLLLHGGDGEDGVGMLDLLQVLRGGGGERAADAVVPRLREHEVGDSPSA